LVTASPVDGHQNANGRCLQIYESIFLCQTGPVFSFYGLYNLSEEFRRQKRSYSDLLTEWLAETNKGRMPYQIPQIRSKMIYDGKFEMSSGGQRKINNLSYCNLCSD
jgi:hypothetical protein